MWAGAGSSAEHAAMPAHLDVCVTSNTREIDDIPVSARAPGNTDLAAKYTGNITETKDDWDRGERGGGEGRGAIATVGITVQVVAMAIASRSRGRWRWPSGATGDRPARGSDR